VSVEGLVIAGERVEAAEGATFETSNPATGQPLATVAEAGVEDVERAVAAARRAAETWGATSPIARGRVLHRFADLLEERSEELALIETRDVGKPLADSRGELGMIVDVVRYYAGAVHALAGQTIPVEAEGVALTFREPIGVVALITPWNFPLNIANWKVAPALAAGNAVVLKPASLTPLSALRYAELALEAGLPPGALNVVPGPGSSVGARLCEHPHVGKVGFTGSTEVGAQVARLAAGTIKRVSLELGGKSACIVFEDADLDRVGERAPYAVFGNAGQDCCARSRLLVQESVADEVLGRYAATAAGMKVALPEQDGCEIGPLISRDQRERVAGYLRIGQDEGARLVVGGDEPGGELAGGWFMRPAVLADVRRDMRVAQEEIFGPVVSVITFRDEAEAVAVANDSAYGLSGSIWTRDGARALRVARAVRTGVLGVNSNSSVFPQTPFGGMKQSGYGRELGIEGMLGNTDLKSVFVSTAAT
jgi:betaine-aldehyde dehydrogenase